MRIVIAAAALALLSGCTGSNFQRGPVGVSGNPNGLKRTPCACAQLPQPAGLPKFLGAPSNLQSQAHA